MLKASTAAVAVAVAAAAALGPATPALASAHSHPAARHTTPHPAKPTRHPAKPTRFHVQGLVVAHAAGTVTLLVKAGRDGATSLAHKRITVHLTTGAKGRLRAHRAAAAFRPGDMVNVVGTDRDGNASTGGDLSVIAAVENPRPARAISGQIVSVDQTAKVMRVHVGDVAGEDGDHGDHETTLVDFSTATVSLDGAATAADQLAVGQDVILVGENNGDTVVAADVFAYTTNPEPFHGTLTAVDPTTGALTVSHEDDGTVTSVTADMSGNPVVLVNGDTATAAALTVGMRIELVGPDTGGTVATQLVLAFDRFNRGPAGDGHTGEPGDN